MKKVGLLALLCVFTLLMGGCANNVGSTSVEDGSEGLSGSTEAQYDIPEHSKQDAEPSGQEDRS